MQKGHEMTEQEQLVQYLQTLRPLNGDTYRTAHCEVGNTRHQSTSAQARYRFAQQATNKSGLVTPQAQGAALTKERNIAPVHTKNSVRAETIALCAIHQ